MVDSIPSTTTQEELGTYYQRLSANNYLYSHASFSPSLFQQRSLHTNRSQHELIQSLSLDQAIGLSFYSLGVVEHPIGFKITNSNPTTNYLSLRGGNLSYLGGDFYYGKRQQQFDFYIKGYGFRGNEFDSNLEEMAARNLASSISLSTISDEKFLLTEEEEPIMIQQASFANSYSNLGLEVGFNSIIIKDISLSTQVGWQQKNGLGYLPVGEYFARKQRGYVNLELSYEKLHAFGSIDYISTGEDAYFYQSGKTFSFQSWGIEGGVSYKDTLQMVDRAPINYEIGVHHQAKPTRTDHTLFGRNEAEVNYNATSAFLKTHWIIRPTTQVSSNFEYGYFDALKVGGFSFKGKIDHQVAKNTQLSFQYQRLTRMPSLFTLYADLPVAISSDFDVWLSGNINSQQANSTSALISWTHPSFRPTPYQAGFSIQQAYHYVNEAAKEQLQERLIELDPRNRPLAGLLNFLLSEEFSPIGFVNDFDSFDYLSSKTFQHDLTGVSSARLSTTNQLSISFTRKIKKLQFGSSIYYLRERHPVQLTSTSPYIILNDLGAYLGQAVQDRIQVPFEELLFSAGGFTLADAQVKAQEIGQVINEVYAQQGDQLFDELKQYPFHGIVGMDVAVRQDKPQLLLGYATLEKSEFLGVDIHASIPIKDFATISTKHYWTNTSTYTTKKVDQETPFIYHFNRPQYRSTTSVEFHNQKKWNALIQYHYEGSFDANLGIYNGVVPVKNIIDFGFNYNFDSGLGFSINATNILDREYQSYPLLPLIGRTISSTITYRFL